MQITIKYNGKYPCLCGGNLIVIIDGFKYNFGQYCLSSGGSTYFTNDYSEEHITTGPWSVLKWPDNFPELLKDLVVEEINNQIPHGCCGGCL